MKTKLLFVLVFITFNLFSQINLVPNGRFETLVNGTTLANWTTKNNVTSYGSGFSKSAKLYIPNNTTKPAIVAQVPMTAGITYTVKFKYRYEDPNYNGMHPISLDISQNGSATILSSSSLASNNKWNVKETTFTPDQTLSYELTISLFTFDDEPFNVLIDDVEVYVQGTEQYTLIPDENFEQKLIDLGYDSGITDGQVLTNNVNQILSLDVSSSFISNLTGIQDFAALKMLICSENQLTNLDVTQNKALTYINSYNNKISSLDVSQNTALTYLNCNLNRLTTLDVTKNTALTTLFCELNQLTSLDVTPNIALKKLHLFGNQLTSLNIINNTALDDLQCNFNKLTNLDVSQNTNLVSLICSANKLKSLNVSQNVALTKLDCSQNELLSLNLKNGKNTLLANANVDFKYNQNLSCIEVDDVTYSNTNWSNKKEANASYSTTCTLGIDDAAFEKIAVYPNPVQGELHIDNVVLEKATIYDSLGKLIKEVKFSSQTHDNILPLNGFQKGIYYIYLESEGITAVKKIIVE
ncbi:leucine-rich repeat domain-containing protein [Flavobacterium pectinovorum]|uniref:leucine-rich repeat domain-containing protein n=1 Tax=Flavobacterium pectinovorum TaxID=29533 RepID=UPI001FAE2A0F|nr:T9SS type A sorting domain-containing protein [Flavobacterium pectinovorum]MCI9844570.1 T9SS type A sorting domain-containing protein [Flavobacterium pectinovorum]